MEILLQGNTASCFLADIANDSCRDCDGFCPFNDDCVYDGSCYGD
jgi:hypothetical protein